MERGSCVCYVTPSGPNIVQRSEQTATDQVDHKWGQITIHYIKKTYKYIRIELLAPRNHGVIFLLIHFNCLEDEGYVEPWYLLLHKFSRFNLSCITFNNIKY